MTAPRLDVADARDMPLPAESVQLIVTSPPYGVGWDYGDGGAGDRRPLAEQLALLAKALAECKRVLRSGGVLALNLPPTIRTPDHRAYPLGAWAEMRLHDQGWLIRESLAWVKAREGRPLASTTAIGAPTNPYLRPTHERVIVASIGDCRMATMTGRPWLDGIHSDYMEILKDTWLLPPGRGKRGHPLAFPDELVTRLVLLYSAPGDIVLDPFAGTCTTVRVAHGLGRRAVGFDIVPECVERGRRMMAAAEERAA